MRLADHTGGLGPVGESEAFANTAGDPLIILHNEHYRRFRRVFEGADFLRTTAPARMCTRECSAGRPISSFPAKGRRSTFAMAFAAPLARRQSRKNHRENGPAGTLSGTSVDLSVTFIEGEQRAVQG